jgi:hypothetical protein
MTLTQPTHKIKFYKNLPDVFESATNSGNRLHLSKLMGMSDVGKLLTIEGPVNRIDTDFAHHFDFTPVPTDYETNLSFDEVSLLAAENLWMKAKDKKIALFWSGGIDSTVAAVSLIMTNSEWQKQLVIYTSNYSVTKEYPLFYEQFLKDKVEIKFLTNHEFFNPELFSDEYVVVDGTCGDQLWGCNVLADMMDVADKPYQELFYHDVFKKIYKRGSKLSLKNNTINYIEKLVEMFPIKTTSIAELYWLLTFTHKWDVVRLRHTSYIKDVTKFGKMNAFFNTENFQRWTMCNADKRLQKEWKTYKQPAKDFIYTFTKDSEYQINKLQHESLGRSIPIGHPQSYVRAVTTSEHQLMDDIDMKKTNVILNRCLKI